MINVILIRCEDIGTKDHDPDILLGAIKELIASGEIDYASLIARYSFATSDLFDAFTSGLDAVGDPADYAYVWEDTLSPKYEEQHKIYSEFKEVLEDYLN